MRYLLMSILVIGAIAISYFQLRKSVEVRKKRARILTVVGLCLVASGFTFNYFHLFSSRIQIIVGVAVLCFLAMPLIVKNRFEKWAEYNQHSLETILVSITDLVSVILLLLGGLFVLQKWTGGETMLLVGGVCFAITFALWNRMIKRIVFRQKEVEVKLHETHDLLKESHREITDSINYAQRIQSAILPPLKQVAKQLQDSFVLYKPKDVVAGDFYWLSKHESRVFIAVADCTGHGVPGAMVSVVCNNALNRSVREYGDRLPGQILDRAREIVIEEFEQSEEDVKDGMDVSLAGVEYSSSAEAKLWWAGANNPLWIVRGDEVIETKATKEPVGKNDILTPFKTHEISLLKGDIIYLFSDGFVDQFGGPKGKKFKSKPFKNLLLSIQDCSMKEQQKLINEAFESWKGALEQVDDVCVIGIRV